MQKIGQYVYQNNQSTESTASNSDDNVVDADVVS
jgi:hypothetical protein